MGASWPSRLIFEGINTLQAIRLYKSHTFLSHVPSSALEPVAYVVLLWLMLAKPRFLRFLGDIVRNKIAENMKIFVKID
jgi:hypothetical protein